MKKDIRTVFTEGLQNYVPKAALLPVVDQLLHYKASLTITKHRVSKFGDYRSPNGKYGHRISINHSLNQYAFLTTLIHEIAHLITHEQYHNTVKAHGEEWQAIYKALMYQFLDKGIYPTDLEVAIKRYLQKPAASSCTDAHLYKMLKKYDTNAEASLTVFVEDLPKGEVFRTKKGLVLVKGDKMRKRYRCQVYQGHVVYSVSPIAEVVVVKVTP